MEHQPSFDDGRPPFDHQLANSLIGKHVLVGISYLDSEGKQSRQIQFHGVVTSADPHKGFHLRLSGELDGEDRWLPPDTQVFAKARLGDYRLKSTGEIVEDPDYTCAFTVSPRTS